MVATGPDPKAGSVPKRASSHGSSRPSTLAIVLAAYGIPTVPTRVALSAEEVEQLITSPMENLLLNGVAFLHGIPSEAVCVGGAAAAPKMTERSKQKVVAEQTRGVAF